MKLWGARGTEGKRVGAIADVGDHLCGFFRYPKCLILEKISRITHLGLLLRIGVDGGRRVGTHTYPDPAALKFALM